MPRDASGDFTLPTNDSSPAQPRNVIRSSDFNELMTDIASGLTDSLSRSGDGAMQAALDMGGFAITNAIFDGAQVTDGTIATAKIADGAVTRPKIATSLKPAIAITPEEHGALANGSDDKAALEAAFAAGVA